MKIHKHVIKGKNDDKITMITGANGTIAISSQQGINLDPMVVLNPKEGFIMGLKMLYYSIVSYVLS